RSPRTRARRRGGMPRSGWPSGSGRWQAPPWPAHVTGTASRRQGCATTYLPVGSPAVPYVLMSHWLLSALAGLAVCQLGALLTTLYLHRGLAHRALALAPPVAFVCRGLTWIVTGIRPRQWVAVHRKHHA